MLDYTASFLPKLEPMLGIAFALNLAYIGLPRFRYREQIQNHTRDKLGPLSNATDETKSTSWYKALSRMAKMNNGEKASNKADFPSEIWAKLYAFLFENHWDRRVVVSFCMILVALLSIGVAHSTEHYGSIFGGGFLWVFSGGMFHFWFIAILLVGLWPCFLAWQGSKVVKDACNYADRQIKDMEITMQAGVGAVDTPAAE